MPELPEAIYLRPSDYDLEHVGDTADVEFFVSLATRLKPKRVLELACGNGRVTLPLAQAGADHGFEVVGIYDFMVGSHADEDLILKHVIMQAQA